MNNLFSAAKTWRAQEEDRAGSRQEFVRLAKSPVIGRIGFRRIDADPSRTEHRERNAQEPVADAVAVRRDPIAIIAVLLVAYFIQKPWFQFWIGCQQRSCQSSEGAAEFRSYRHVGMIERALEAGLFSPS